MRTVAANDVHLYRLDLDDSDTLYADKEDQFLSVAERTKANKFVHDIHRVRYTRGRTLMRKVLADYLDVPASKVVIKEQERGKPYVDKNSIEFNLSHAENLAVLAVTKNQQIGIDLESFTRLVELDELSKIHFTEFERNWLSSYSEIQRQQAFFWLWTAKEARMKVTGEGFALASTEIEIECLDSLPDYYRIPKSPSVHLKPLTDVFPDSACCLATTEPVQQVMYQG